MSSTGFYLITTCALKDIETFLEALPAIKAFINPDFIFVATPSSTLSLLQNRCKHETIIKLYADEQVIPSDELTLLNNCFIDLDIQKSQGWYLQQILKIYLAASCPDDALILIWDSDTVPLRPLSFKDNNNILYYSTSREYHAPYFDILFSCLQLTRLSDRSFIAQCLPMYGRWVQSFLSYVTKHGYNSLSHALVYSAYKCNPNSIKFGFFSEYETLGNYFLANYSDSFKERRLSWFRYGAYVYFLTRSIDASSKILRLFFCYSSFEHLNVPLLHKILAPVYRHLCYNRLVH